MLSHRGSSRRAARACSGATVLALFVSAGHARADATRYLAEAFRLRDEATAAGDQPYGAVLVLEGRIVGEGRSRVVSDRNADHHAERVALWNAQKALGRDQLAGAVIYSSSVPCMACQSALARAKVSRMIHGRDATDAGAPRSG
ncbi:MAG: deaminase [Beijerinckiaceae bacterium]